MSQPNSDIAYAKLHEMIATGEIAPGERVMEVELAQLTGLSRTPVREAIRRMESDGLLVHQARVGAVVRRLDHQEIVELYEMRIVLERAAASMAALHISSGELSLLQRVNDDMREATTSSERARLNAEFHSDIFKAARNRFLLENFATLANVLLLLGATTLHSEVRLEKAYEQHQSIINAIAARDANQAALAMETHMHASLTERLRGLE